MAKTDKKYFVSGTKQESSKKIRRYLRAAVLATLYSGGLMFLPYNCFDNFLFGYGRAYAANISITSEIFATGKSSSYSNTDITHDAGTGYSVTGNLAHLVNFKYWGGWSGTWGKVWIRGGTVNITTTAQVMYTNNNTYSGSGSYTAYANFNSNGNAIWSGYENATTTLKGTYVYWSANDSGGTKAGTQLNFGGKTVTLTGTSGNAFYYGNYNGNTVNITATTATINGNITGQNSSRTLSLNINKGTTTLNGSLNTITSTVNIASGATFTLTNSNGGNGGSGNTFSNATFSGDGTLKMTGGTINGAVTNNVTMNITGGAITSAITNNKTINATAANGVAAFQNTVTNAGTVNLTATGTMNANAKISGGVLNIGSSSVSGITVTASGTSIASSTTTIHNGDTLKLNAGTLGVKVVSNGTAGTGILEIAGNVTANAGYIAANTNKVSSGTLTFNGGSFAPTLTGAGNVTIATASGGTVTINGYLKNTGIVTVNSGSTLYAMADHLRTGNVTNNGKVVLNSGTVGQVITGGSIVINDAQSTGVYSLANRIAGATTISSGKNLYLTGNTLGGKVSGSGTLHISGAVTANASNIAATTNTIDSGKTLTLNGGTLGGTVSGVGTLKISGDVVAKADLIRANTTIDSGKTLSINTGYTGNPSIQTRTDGTGYTISGDGKIVVGGSTNSSTDLSVWKPTGGITVNSGMTWNAYATNIGAAVTNNGTVNIFDLNGKQLTLGGKITGGTIGITYNGTPAGVIKTDAGNINGNTNYFVKTDATLNLVSGTLGKQVLGYNKAVASGGTIKVSGNVTSNASYLAAGVNTIDSGKTLTLNGGSTVAKLSGEGNITINGNVSSSVGNLANNGTLTVNSGKTLTLTSGTLGKAISNSGTVQLNGATLNAARVTAGTLQFSADLTTNAGYVAAATNTIDSGKTLTLNTGTLAGPVSGSGTLSITGSVTSAKNISSVVSIGTAGTLTSSGGAISGKVTNSGTLAVTNGSVSGAVTNNKTMTLNGTGSVTGAVTNGTAGTYTITTGTQSGTVTNNNSFIVNGGVVSGAVTNSKTMSVTGGEVNKGITNNAAGTVTVSGGEVKTTAVTNNGTLSVTNGKISAAVTNNKTMTLNGTGQVSGTVTIGTAGSYTISKGTQTGAVTNNNSFTINGGTVQTGTVTNNKTMSITGGVITSAITNGTAGIIDVSGTNGVAALQSTITNSKTVNLLETGTLNTAAKISGGTLNIGSASVTGKTVTASGTSIAASTTTVYDGDTLKLNAGTLGGKVTSNGTAGTGILEIAGNVTADAGYIAANTNKVSSGILTLSGSTLSKDITGDGQVTIQAGKTVTANAMFNNKKLLIDTGATLNIDVDRIGGNLGTAGLTNNGTIGLTANGSDEDGTGHTDTLQATLTGGTLLFNAGSYTIYSTADKIKGAANKVSGKLSLTGNTLTAALTNGTLAGNVIISGTVETQTNISTSNVTINADKKLTVSGGTISGAVTNNGTLAVTNGSISSAVANNKTMTLDGTGQISGKVTTAAAGTYTITAGTQTGAVENKGTFNVGGGTVKTGDVTNSGAMNVTGGVITSAITSNSGTVNASTAGGVAALQSAITNMGTVNLTATGTLNASATINGGTLNIGSATESDTVTITANANSIGAADNNVNTSDTLKLNAGALGKAITNKGTVELGGITTMTAAVNGGTLNIGQDLETAADNINGATNTIGSGKTLTLTNGTSRQDLTGGGNIIIKSGNTVNANALYNTTGTLTVQSTATLNIDVDRLLTGTGTATLVNSGTIGMTANNADEDSVAHPNSTDTLQVDLTGTGTYLFNADSYTIHTTADHIKGTGANKISGNLALTGGALTVALTNGTSAGNVIISGTVETQTNISTSNVTINADKKLTVSGGTISGAVTNNGTLAVTNGSISSAVANNKTMTLDGTGQISGKVTTAAAGSYTVTAGTQTGAVENKGTFNVEGGTVSTGDVTNSGIMNVTGGTITSKITSNSGTINAGTGDGVAALQNAITSTGTVNLTSTGILNTAAVINGGTLNIGSVTATDTVTITADANSIAAANNKVNAGDTLTLTGGTLAHAVTGDATGTVNLDSGLAGMTAAVTGGTLNINTDLETAADNINGVTNAIVSGKTLTLTNGTSRQDLTGGGNIIIKSGNTVNAEARYNTTGTLTVENTATLNIDVDRIGDGFGSTNLINEGTIGLTADGLDEDSTAYPNSTDTLQAVLTGTGTYLFNAGGNTIHADADKIKGAGTNKLNGKLALTGGTLTAALQKGDTEGKIEISGEVETRADITDLGITVDGGKKLTVTGGNITGGAITNNGIVNITGGSQSGTITNNGAMTVANAAFLTGADTLTNNSGGSITLTTGTLDRTIVNSGTVTLGDSIITTKDIGSGGKIVVDGVGVQANAKLQAANGDGGYININAGKDLTIAALRVGGVVKNAGTLNLTSAVAGALTNRIDSTDTGTSRTYIKGDITSNVAINDNIEVTLGNKLTIGASNIGGNVTNNAAVVLNTGTLEKKITDGTVTVAGGQEVYLGVSGDSAKIGDISGADVTVAGRLYVKNTAVSSGTVSVSENIALNSGGILDMQDGANKTYKINGNLESTNGSLYFDMIPTSGIYLAASDHDKMEVTGNATGTLKLDNGINMQGDIAYVTELAYATGESAQIIGVKLSNGTVVNATADKKVTIAGKQYDLMVEADKNAVVGKAEFSVELFSVTGTNDMHIGTNQEGRYETMTKHGDYAYTFTQDTAEGRKGWLNVTVAPDNLGLREIINANGYDQQHNETAAKFNNYSLSEDATLMPPFAGLKETYNTLIAAGSGRTTGQDAALAAIVKKWKDIVGDATGYDWIGTGTVGTGTVVEKLTAYDDVIAEKGLGTLDKSTGSTTRILTINGNGHKLLANPLATFVGVTVNSGYTLKLNNIAEVSGFKDYVVKNDGTVELSNSGAMTLNSGVTNGTAGTGTVNIIGSKVTVGDGYTFAQNRMVMDSASEMTVRASDLQITDRVYNAGTLNLKGGTANEYNTLNSSVVDNGISGVINIKENNYIKLTDGKTVTNRVNIAENAGFTAKAEDIKGAVGNAGKLNLGGGNLANGISGEGATEITAAVTLSSTNTQGISQNALTVDAGASLNAKADRLAVTEAIVNEGTLTLTGNGVTFNNAVKNADGQLMGRTVIDGVVTANKLLDQRIEISSSDDQLTLDVDLLGIGNNASTLKNIVANSGTVVLTADTTINGVTGKTVADTLEKVIEGGKITIAGDISSNVANLKGEVTNAVNTLTLTGGSGSSYEDLTVNIGGAGSTVIQGLINNDGKTITQNDLIVTETGGLKTDASKVVVANGVTNLNALELTGGDLASDIRGDASPATKGATTVTGTVTNTGNRSITQNKLTVTATGTLTTDPDMLAIGDTEEGIKNLGKLVLSGDGTVEEKITGGGELEINGDIVAKESVTQGSMTIDDNNSLTMETPGKALTVTSLTVNKGKLTVGAGDLKGAVNSTNRDDEVVLGAGILEMGRGYTITGGKLTLAGDVVAAVTDIRTAGGIRNDAAGQKLVLMGSGTLGDGISGAGVTVIGDGAHTSAVEMAGTLDQDVTVNSRASLEVEPNKLNGNITLVPVNQTSPEITPDNGKVVVNAAGQTFRKTIGGFGTAEINGKVTMGAGSGFVPVAYQGMVEGAGTITPAQYAALPEEYKAAYIPVSGIHIDLNAEFAMEQGADIDSGAIMGLNMGSNGHLNLVDDESGLLVVVGTFHAEEGSKISLDVLGEDSMDSFAVLGDTEGILTIGTLNIKQELMQGVDFGTKWVDIPITGVDGLEIIGTKTALGDYLYTITYEENPDAAGHDKQLKIYKDLGYNLPQIIQGIDKTGAHSETAAGIATYSFVQDAINMEHGFVNSGDLGTLDKQTGADGREFSMNGNQHTLNGGGFSGITVREGYKLTVTDIFKLDNFRNGTLAVNDGALISNGIGTTELNSSVIGTGTLIINNKLVVGQTGYSTTEVTDFRGQVFRKNANGKYVDVANNELADQSLDNVRKNGVMTDWDGRSQGRAPVPGWVTVADDFEGVSFKSLESVVTAAAVQYAATGSPTYTDGGITVELNVPVISQGNLTVVGSLTANAGQIVIPEANAITVDGSMYLTGGALNNSVTGTGKVVVDGARDNGNGTFTEGEVTLNGNIVNDIEVKEHNVLNITADNIADENSNRTVTNSGEIKLGAGTLNNRITDGSVAGRITLTGNVAADAANLGSATYIQGNTLKLKGADVTGSAITKAVMGVDDEGNYTGKVEFTGGRVVNNVLVKAADLSIDSGATFNSGLTGLDIGNGFANEGTFNLNTVTDVNLVNNITGGGTTNFVGTGTVTNTKKITQGTVTLAANVGLSTSYDKIEVDVLQNGGTLTLTGNGTFETQIDGFGSGAGTTVIDGIIADGKALNNKIIINSEKGLTIAADHVGGAVTNSGTLTLTGGNETTMNVLNNTVSGAGGSLKIMGNVMNNTGNGISTGDLKIYTGCGFTADLRDMNLGENNITNDGSFVLLGGVLDNQVVETNPSDASAAMTVIQGRVEVKKPVANTLVVNAGGTLTTGPFSVGKALVLKSGVDSATGELTTKAVVDINAGGTFDKSIKGAGQIDVNADVTMVSGSGFTPSYYFDLTEAELANRAKAAGDMAGYATHMVKAKIAVNPLTGDITGTLTDVQGAVLWQMQQDQAAGRGIKEEYVIGDVTYRPIVPMTMFDANVNAALNLADVSGTGSGGLNNVVLGANGHLNLQNNRADGLVLKSFEAVAGSRLSLDVLDDDVLDSFLVLGNANGTLNLENVNIAKELMTNRVQHITGITDLDDGEYFATKEGDVYTFYDVEGRVTTDPAEYVKVDAGADGKIATPITTWKDLPIYGIDTLNINSTVSANGAYIYTISYEEYAPGDKQLKVVKSLGYSLHQIIQGYVDTGTEQGRTAGYQAAKINNYSFDSHVYNIGYLKTIVESSEVTVSVGGGADLGIMTRTDAGDGYTPNETDTAAYETMHGGRTGGANVRNFSLNGNGKNLDGGGWGGITIQSGDTLTLTKIGKVNNFANGIVAKNDGTIVLNSGDMEVEAGITNSNNDTATGVMRIDGANVTIANTAAYLSEGAKTLDMTTDSPKFLNGSGNEISWTQGTPVVCQREILIAAGGLKANADALQVGTIINDAKLTLTDAATAGATTTLTASVSGSGEFVVDATDLVAQKGIANKITVNVGDVAAGTYNGKLTIEAANIGGAVTNNGMIVVTANNTAFAQELARTVTGGSVQIGGASAGSSDVVGEVISMTADKLVLPASVNVNSGDTLRFTGESNISYGNVTISGGGITEIAGNIIANSRIATTGGIKVAGSLTADGANIGADVTNNGAVVLTGGELEYDVSGGILTIDGEVTSAAGHILGNTNTVNNLKTLLLNGGTLTKALGGAGSTLISQNVTSDASIATQGGITISAGKQLIIEAVNVGAAVTNNGSIIVTSNPNALAQELTYAITGGSVQIGGANNSGDVENEVISMTADKLVNSVSVTVHDKDTLKLTGTSALEAALAGEGVTEIAGTVTANSRIATAGGIKVSGALTADAGNVGADVDSTGRVMLTGGELLKKVAGGELTVGGGVTSDAGNILGGTNIVNSGKTLTLKGGTLTRELTGAGSTVVDGVVTADAGVATAGGITVKSGKQLTIEAMNVGAAVVNNGSIIVTANNTVKEQELTYAITGGSVQIGGASASSGDVENEVISMTADKLAGSTSVTVNTGDKLNLTGTNDLTLAENAVIAGAGAVEIAGTVTSRAGIVVTGGFAVSGTLTTVAGNIGADVTNSGILNLTDGSLEKVVTGGVLNIAGEVASAAGNILGDTNTVNSGKTLTLKGGTLTRELTGAGSTVVDGDVTADAGIATAGGINVKSGKQLTIDVGNLGVDTVNEGNLNLNGNEDGFDREMGGSGKLTVNGTVVNADGNDIRQGTLEIAGSLTAALTDLEVDNISNGGRFVTGGTLDQNILGSGTTELNGELTVKSQSEIEGTLDGNGQTLDMQNGSVGNKLTVGKLSNTVNLKIDVDLANNTSDKLSIGAASGTAINLAGINITGDMVVGEELNVPKVYTNSVAYVEGTGTDAAVYGITGDTEQAVATNSYIYQFSLGDKGMLNYTVAETEVTLKNFLERNIVEGDNDPGVLSLTEDMTGEAAGTATVANDSQGKSHINLNGHTLNAAEPSLRVVVEGNRNLSINAGDGGVVGGNIVFDTRDGSNLVLEGAMTLDSDAGGTGNVVVNGVVTVSSRVAVGKVVVGAGNVLIVAENGELGTTGGIANKGSITVDADGLKSTVAGSEGSTVTLRAGTLDADSVISGGSIVVVGDVSADADALRSGNGIANTGHVLALTGGTLTDNITGGGTTRITGTVAGTEGIANNVEVSGTGNFTNTGTITGAVTNNGTMATVAGGISNGVTNSGTLFLTGGDLGSAITGTGTTNITGAVTNNNGKGITQDELTIESAGALTTNGDALVIGNDAGTITNKGNLTLTGGTLQEKIVDATGSLTIDGDVVGLNDITQKDLTIKSGRTLSMTESGKNLTVTNDINNQGTLTIGASELQSKVANSGTVALKDGTLASGKTITGGAVTLDGAVTANVGDLLSTAGIANASGNLTLTGEGALADDILGNGTTKIDGNITSDKEISNTLIVNGGKSLTNTGTVSGAVNNEGTLTNRGNISGAVTNAGDMTNSGIVSGPVTNSGNFNNSGNVGGNLNNSGIFDNTEGILNGMVANGAGGTLTTKLEGISNWSSGNVSNSGTLNITDGGELNGHNIANTGTVNMEGIFTVARNVMDNNGKGITITGGIINVAATSKIDLGRLTKQDKGKTFTLYDFTNATAVGDDGSWATLNGTYTDKNCSVVTGANNTLKQFTIRDGVITLDVVGSSFVPTEKPDEGIPTPAHGVVNKMAEEAPAGSKVANLVDFVSGLDDGTAAGKMAAADTINAAMTAGEAGGVEHGVVRTVAFVGETIGTNMSVIARPVLAVHNNAVIKNMASDKDANDARIEEVEVARVSEIMPVAYQERKYEKTVWASYMHNKEDIDGMQLAGSTKQYGTAQYNGTTVGIDLWSSNKVIGGVAIAYTKGDVNSTISNARTKNEVDYYGVSVYNRWTNGNTGVLADVGFMHANNELTQTIGAGEDRTDAKINSITAGVRFEQLISIGRSNLMPFAGVRYMFNKNDEYSIWGNTNAPEDQHIISPQVGVAWNGDFAIPGSKWTFRPTVEGGYVWNLGDRHTESKVSFGGVSNTVGYDVADKGSYYGLLGMEFRKDNVILGVTFKYQKGDAVKNRKWNFNMSFVF